MERAGLTTFAGPTRPSVKWLFSRHQGISNLRVVDLLLLFSGHFSSAGCECNAGVPSEESGGFVGGNKMSPSELNVSSWSAPQVRGSRMSISATGRLGLF